MGILDVFKKKKEEDYSPPDYTQNQPDQFQNQNFQPQQDFGQNMNGQDQMNQQFPPPFSAPNQQPQQYSQDSYDNMPRGQAAGYPPEREIRGRETNNLAEINMGKDFEIINAKLDAIKAELDSINQRVKRIERMNEPQTGKHDAWY